MRPKSFTFGKGLIAPPHQISMIVRDPGRSASAVNYDLVPCSPFKRPHSARRVKVEESNLDFARRWISLCEKRHGCECDEPTMPQNPSRNLEIPHFRLIDVRRSRLVKASLSWEYFALSYVWGSQFPFFVTTSSRLEELEEPGGLNGYWNEIPLTIRDAVAAVARLGFRYLWIDSICIVQDDIEAQSAIIANMDLV